jgi:spermidine/putrescine transport system substrate-binding protein
VPAAGRSAKPERPFEIHSLSGYPKEGAVLASTVSSCTSSGGRPDLAHHAFINFMLDGANAADVSNLIGAGNPNAAAMPLHSP